MTVDLANTTADLETDRAKRDYALVNRRDDGIRPGDRFGRLTAIHRVPGPGPSWWVLRCECGREHRSRIGALKSGSTRSCGCRKGVTHGLDGTPEHVAWEGMKGRCFRRTCTSWDRYGGRGVTVCTRWRASFGAFLADMGRKPSASHSIDRIDNDGNYSCGHCEECVAKGWPANCRWATREEQASNKSPTPGAEQPIEYADLVMSVSEWADLFGLSVASLLWRVQRGWPVEAALFTPELFL